MDIQGQAISADGIIDLSVDTAAGKPQILAIDPKAGKVIKQVDEPRATDLHVANGSLWASGLSTNSSGGVCTVTRFDPATLDVQATFPIPCTFGYTGPRIVSMGTSVWFVDTSAYDLNSNTGAKLTRIDPDTNKPGRSVDLGYMGGCCQDAPTAVYCSCSQGSLSRLTDEDPAFVDLGTLYGVFPAGDGLWTTDQSGNAMFIEGTGGPSATIPIEGNQVVGGDATGVYYQRSRAQEELLRQPADGSPAVQVATAPVLGTGVDQVNLDYLTGNPVKFAMTDGLATIWLVQGKLYLQWAPLP